MESRESEAFCFIYDFFEARELRFLTFLPSIRVSYTVACVTRLGLLALGGLRFIKNSY